jgi:hypothetical protein
MNRLATVPGETAAAAGVPKQQMYTKQMFAFSRAWFLLKVNVNILLIDQ